jgi:hypothetical protein
MEKSTEIGDFVLNSYKSMLDGDVRFGERHMSQRDDLLVIGTDPNEWWEGYATVLEVLRPQTEALAGSVIKGDPQAYVEGSVGWFADNVEWKLPNGALLSARLTGVCHKEDGDWKIVQWHWSIGVPNEEAFGQELAT